MVNIYISYKLMRGKPCVPRMVPQIRSALKMGHEKSEIMNTLMFVSSSDNRVIPVMPVGGITTRASCPCLTNISRISIGFASAGKFFTKIVVFDRFFGAYELHQIRIS